MAATTSLFHRDSRNVYRVAPLGQLEWLEHGFGTRLSGVWLPRGKVVSLRQIHSDICVCVDGQEGMAGQGDAMLCDTPDQLLVVRTADCFPILIADEHRRAVAAVHAGWRGTARAIAMRAVETLRARFGSRPEDLHAAIGPGICAGCYEVDPEIAAQFEAWGAVQPGERPRVDLASAIRLQLASAGVSPQRIYDAGLCTFCNPQEFCSYRRGDTRGRMLSFVARGS